jgi:hypothetical protein
MGVISCEPGGLPMNKSDGSSRRAVGGSEPSAILYVITLASAVAPMPLRAPMAPQLAGLAVFRSRHIEDGRERFRLHLGFFATEEDAERFLPIVREDYPAALVAVAPEGSMGSLDDTAVARFSILRPIAKPAVRPAMARPPVAAPAPRSAPPPTLRIVGSPPRPVPSAPAVAVRPRQPLATPKPAVARVAPAHPATRSLLNSPPAPTFSGQADAERPAPPVEVIEAEIGEEAPPRETQHYAVQLIWNRGPIDLEKIPLLAIFTGYLLYAVESEPGPRRFYGVRLGFYADALSARLVAQYVRSEFKGVSVVPVSQRETSRASSAAIRLGASRRAQSPSGSRARWPASALSVDIQNLRLAFTPGVS